MDLVNLLEDAVKDLPPGGYGTGLHAIVRHVKAAIRHLERDQSADPDSCTDAIYRTNQAYEGSLKEAYRVLAGKDPSGVSPFTIEGYLETNNIVRPRVLTQLTRYRQDYRNPSTHDYKLDFDSDEALLAIVAVCGFAKLLINQIKSNVESQAAQKRAAQQVNLSKNISTHDPELKIAEACLAYVNESSSVGWFEFERGLAKSIEDVGFAVQVLIQEDSTDDDISLWDIIVDIEGKKFVIDSRVSKHSRPEGTLVELRSYESIFKNNDMAGGLFTIRSRGRTGFNLFRGESGSKPVFFVCENDKDQITQLSLNFGKITKLK